MTNNVLPQSDELPKLLIDPDCKSCEGAGLTRSLGRDNDEVIEECYQCREHTTSFNLGFKAAISAASQHCFSRGDANWRFALRTESHESRNCGVEIANIFAYNGRDMFEGQPVVWHPITDLIDFRTVVLGCWAQYGNSPTEAIWREGVGHSYTFKGKKEFSIHGGGRPFDEYNPPQFWTPALKPPKPPVFEQPRKGGRVEVKP